MPISDHTESEIKSVSHRLRQICLCVCLVAAADLLCIDDKCLTEDLLCNTTEIRGNIQMVIIDSCDHKQVSLFELCLISALLLYLTVI